jgi:hypothetical protein
LTGREEKSKTPDLQRNEEFFTETFKLTSKPTIRCRHLQNSDFELIFYSLQGNKQNRGEAMTEASKQASKYMYDQFSTTFSPKLAVTSEMGDHQFQHIHRQRVQHGRCAVVTTDQLPHHCAELGWE